jgi:hypothetical protein
MYKYILIFSFVLIIQEHQLFSQKKDSTFTSKNTIYADFASKGVIYSINYDRIFLQRQKLAWSYRVGFSILEDAVAFPVSINAFTGKNASHAEFSLTLMPYIDHYKSFLGQNDQSDKYLYIMPSVGYRFQKPKGKFFFKAAILPSVFLDPPSSDFWDMDPRFYLIGNIGLGISF